MSKTPLKLFNPCQIKTYPTTEKIDLKQLVLGYKKLQTSRNKAYLTYTIITKRLKLGRVGS